MSMTLSQVNGHSAAVPSVVPIRRSMPMLREQQNGRRAQVVAGRPAAVERQHKLGKRTARERLELLLDPDSFLEIDIYRRHQASALDGETAQPYTDGVITGSGTVHGRRVFVYAQDFTI